MEKTTLRRSSFGFAVSAGIVVAVLAGPSFAMADDSQPLAPIYVPPASIKVPFTPIEVPLAPISPPIGG